MTTKGIIGYGQSLSIGIHGLPLLSTTQSDSNILTFNSGPRSTGPGGFNPGLTALKPLVEDILPNYDGVANKIGETPCSGLANTIRQLGANDRLIVSAAGHGSYEIELLVKGSNWYPKLLEHVSAGYNLCSGDYECFAIYWIQGERNALIDSTFQYYLNQLKQFQLDIQADIKAITGQTSPVYLVLPQTTHLITSNPNVALAQYQASLDVPEIILVSPMYNLDRFVDGIHLKNISSRKIGAYFGDVLSKILLGKPIQRWKIEPLGIFGNTIKIKIQSPVPPIRIEKTLIPITQNNGFTILDASGGSKALSFSIKKLNELSIISDRILVPPVAVRYALDYLSPSGPNINGGASGNLRDSNPAIVTLGGTVIRLWTPCPAFQVTMN